MKRLLLLFCLLLVFTSCGSDDADHDVKPVFQNNDVCKLVTFNVDGEARVQQFLYDNEGRLVRMETSYNGGAANSYELFDYNSQNKISKRNYYSYDKFSGYTTYEYNAAGLLVRVATYRIKDGGNGLTEEIQTKTYEYSSPTELKKATVTWFDNPEQTWLYEYNNGLMHTARHYNPAGTLAETISLEYDDRDRAFIEPLNLMNDLFGERLGYPYYRNIEKLTITKPYGFVVKQNSYTSTFEYNSDGYTTQEISTRLNQSYPSTLSYSYNCK